MADWKRLTDALAGVDTAVDYTWNELAALVGDLPAAATTDRAWWSGDRPHVRAWRHAGFEVAAVVPERQVTFVRGPLQSSLATDQSVTKLVGPEEAATSSASLLLVTCVKEKLDVPAAARDLYVSPLFKKQRAYAEASGLPWFILSAEHGLVAPDEWLAPYERYLPRTPKSYRAAWGTWVVERLELLAGSLRDQVVEIHASQAYIDALRDGLEAKQATIADPLAGLAVGQRLAWYADSVAGNDQPHRGAAVGSAHSLTDDLCAQLTTAGSAVSPSELVAGKSEDLKRPGLYSWWVDEAGAADLSSGLGLQIEAGLIYAGLAGATRWPSGRHSTNTLWSRITGMHLGGRHEFSTFRRSLGSILAVDRGEGTIDEGALSLWMHAHLAVITVAVDDADTLGRLEHDVLRRLDPPLNLMGMAATPARRRLKELRKPHAAKAKR